MRIEVERLIKHAERDLGSARGNIGIDRYEVAAFLAHQAVEKFLKAAWMVVKHEAPPRTHSLIEDPERIAQPKAHRKHLGYLNPDYVTARYPDAANGVPYEVYDREMAEAKVTAAEEAFEWLRRLTATKE